MTAEKSYFSIDYPKIYREADRLHRHYKTNSPFPNCVIDDFFDASTYKNICHTFPEPDSDIWKTTTSRHSLEKSITKRGALDLKEFLFDERQRRLFMELNSSLFIHFLERLSGIDGLMPDPYFAESGYTMSKTGGTLNIHADFSHHDKTGLERRLNVLIYLNDGWKDEFGGCLKLYDPTLKPVKGISPNGNRLAIFSTSDQSFHGFPDAIKCPDDMVRKSINLYYYTLPRKERAGKRIFFPGDPDFIHTPTQD